MRQALPRQVRVIRDGAEAAPPPAAGAPAGGQATAPKISRLPAFWPVTAFGAFACR
ncbi:hypothetical protein GCM10010517_29520 [Streptosporangium fragile]|uniref:Uncharacterized protein n=1 Tax=Streptosporangium fragile TaxID=46186 RepID=A0ABP6IF81_9ACTN